MGKNRRKRKRTCNISELPDESEAWEVERPMMIENGKPCPFNDGLKLMVYLKPLVWNQMMSLTKALDTEWIGYLTGLIDEDGNFQVAGLRVPEQDVSASSASSREDPHISVPDHIGWCHSHVNMGAFWSEVDKDTIAQHKLAIVMNKDGTYKATVVRLLPCGTRALIEPEVSVGIPEELTGWVNQVKSKIHARTYNYSGSQGSASRKCPWEDKPKRALKKCKYRLYSSCTYISNNCPFKGTWGSPSQVASSPPYGNVGMGAYSPQTGQPRQNPDLESFLMNGQDGGPSFPDRSSFHDRKSSDEPWTTGLGTKVVVSKAGCKETCECSKMLVAHTCTLCHPNTAFSGSYVQTPIKAPESQAVKKTDDEGNEWTDFDRTLLDLDKETEEKRKVEGELREAWRAGMDRAMAGRGGRRDDAYSEEYQGWD